jgi:hypothetical protein
LLFEFPIVRSGFLANCESDAWFSGLVRHRISSEPDSGIARRSFRGFRDLQEGRCVFVTISIIVKPPSIKSRPPNNSVAVRVPRCEEKSRLRAGWLR